MEGNHVKSTEIDPSFVSLNRYVRVWMSKLVMASPLFMTITDRANPNYLVIGRF